MKGYSISVQHNIPNVEFSNLYFADKFAEPFFNWLIGKNDYSKVKNHFIQMGEAAAIATPLSQVADLQSPKLKQYDTLGNRIDKIEYHPAYQELRKLSYGRGIVGIKFDKNFLKDHSPIRHRVGFGAGWYFSQTETGLYCPICMTDALARVLEIHGEGEAVQKALEHIGSSDLTKLWEGSMYLTERQGGSDVGQNIVKAKKVGNGWTLSGHKWFCSNADAGVILALARMPGEEGEISKGTRGLGLFLVLREEAQKTIQMNRLKDKLGVRSMASVEIDFVDTPAHLIGGANEGFRMMADMVNMSRLYNSVASLGVIQRACLEALFYGQNRIAFGKDISKLPLWRSKMAELLAENFSMRALIFFVVKQLDLADAGAPEHRKLHASVVRILTPLIKALAGKQSVYTASEAMELIGGNAYIEEHIMPRLLRDAQVLPIWEGTTNIQALDFLRALVKEGTDAFFKTLDSLSFNLNESVKSIVKSYKQDISTWLQLDQESVQIKSLDMMKKTQEVLYQLLLLDMSTQPDLADISRTILQYKELKFNKIFANQLYSLEEKILSSF